MLSLPPRGCGRCHVGGQGAVVVDRGKLRLQLLATERERERDAVEDAMMDATDAKLHQLVEHSTIAA